MAGAHQAEAGAGVPTVVLPCPPDQFNAFIAGLLGRPQTIESNVPGPFEINKDDVGNLFQLLDQRVKSQNEASLVQFTARIVYDDGSSVLLNSLRDFVSYNEVKPLVSKGLHLSWTFLIKFPTKSFPEKQTVLISFVGDPDRHIFRSQALRIVVSDTEPGSMSIRIEHTDRTWGTDIEALMKGQLQLYQKPVTAARRFTNQHSAKIGFLVGASALLIALGIAYRITDNFALAYLEKAQALKKIGPSSEIVAR